MTRRNGEDLSPSGRRFRRNWVGVCKGPRTPHLSLYLVSELLAICALRGNDRNQGSTVNKFGILLQRV
jgi:hypothetical protein